MGSHHRERRPLARGQNQFAGGVIGEQEEKALGEQHGPETRTERVLGQRSTGARRRAVLRHLTASVRRGAVPGEFDAAGAGHGVVPTIQARPFGQ